VGVGQGVGVVGTSVAVAVSFITAALGSELVTALVLAHETNIQITTILNAMFLNFTIISSSLYNNKVHPFYYGHFFELHERDFFSHNKEYIQYQ
jgi:hypothetical protein